MSRLSVIIITLNEENKIQKCLEAVSWADEIVVVDSFSTDNTVGISKNYTDKIFQRKFDNFRDQKNYAIEQATCEWVLSLDADEIATDELKKEILVTINSSDTFNGYYVPIRNYFLGRELKHGGVNDSKWLRLFRKESGKFCNLVHERVVVQGEIGRLSNAIIHHSFDTLRDYFRKFKHYTDLEALYLKEQNRKISLLDVYLRPWLKFLYTYFFKMGFLDGFKGLMFYFFSACYVSVKFSKYKKLKRADLCA